MTGRVTGLTGIGPLSAAVQPAAATGAAAGGAAFRQALGVEFSRHAVERMQQRGISLDEADRAKIGEAVDRCASKGSKDALLLLRDLGLIVNIKNRKVLTAVDTEQLQDKVFTNIDSTMILRND